MGRRRLTGAARGRAAAARMSPAATYGFHNGHSSENRQPRGVLRDVETVDTLTFRCAHRDAEIVTKRRSGSSRYGKSIGGVHTAGQQSP